MFKKLFQMVFKLAETILFQNTTILSCLYVTLVFISSVIIQFYTVPQSYFSDKEGRLNFLMINSYYIIGAISVPFVFFCSLIYCFGNIIKILRHTFRALAVIIIIYYVHTMLKEFANMVGLCDRDSKIYTTKETCLATGYVWDRFNISGHTFYLFFWILMIVEEVKVIKQCDRIKLLSMEEFWYDEIFEISASLSKLTENELKVANKLYKYLSPVIETLFICLAFFVLILYPMIVSTIIYFHSVLEKVWGAILAILLWYILYGGFIFLLPGEGFFLENERNIVEMKNKHDPLLDKKCKTKNYTLDLTVCLDKGLPLGSLNIGTLEV